MAEDNQTEMVKPQGEQTAPPEQPEQKPAEITSKAKDASDLEAELEKTRKALKDANREAADRRKRLDELEKAEQERQQAQMSEQEKLQARLKELEQSISQKDQLLKARDLQDLQSKVAKSVAKELGVSIETAEGLAGRLKGTSEEELTEDAKVVFALLPKQEAEQPKKPTPKLDPTNPGNAQKGETMAQKKARLRGTNGNPFSGDGAEARGGGVIFVNNE